MKIVVTVLVIVALFSFGGLFLWERAQVADAESQTAAFAEEVEAREQVAVTFVASVPENTPADQTVYLSGSHPSLGSWDAAGLPLEQAEDGSFRGQTTLQTGVPYLFKATRGSWSTVETQADEEEQPNRGILVEPEMEVVVEIARWVDNGETIPNRLTTTGDIRLHERRFASVVDASKPRSLVVYLPPGYDDPANAETTYPVLYVHDGQNLFNEATTYAGVEWKLDESAQGLIASGQIEPVVIVGVYNTENRDAEYGPQVAAYAKHFADEIKPFVEQTYRVETDRESTTLMGAGLGGRAALEVARLQPELFGNVVALSPWVVDESGNAVTDDWASAGDKAIDWAKRTRFLLDTVDDPRFHGTTTPAADFALASDWLESHEANLDATVYQSGQAEHRESSWGQRASAALRSLYGNEGDADSATASTD